MIALATADLTEVPVDDVDRRPLEQAFADRASAEYVRWDDETVDWSAYELVVLRSTWDYSTRLAEFGHWLRDVAATTRVLNSPQTVAWNLDKRYLQALLAGGVPVVQTAVVDSLADFDRELAALEAGQASGRMSGQPSRQIVVKPTVSAGSIQTGRFNHADPGARELTGEILEVGKQVMLQPYYESVTRQGEVAVVHFNGVFSHAFRKGPILDTAGRFLSGEYAEVVDAVTVTDALLGAAERVLDRYRELAAGDPASAAAEPLLYSRVDLIEDAAGQPRCLELELIEPTFFLSTDPKSADRFVDAVLARL